LAKKVPGLRLFSTRISAAGGVFSRKKNVGILGIREFLLKMMGIREMILEIEVDRVFCWQSDIWLMITAWLLKKYPDQ